MTDQIGITLALDIGGTKIAAGLVKNKRVFEPRKINTVAHRGANKVLKNLHDMIKLYLRHRPGKICVSFAGPVDHTRGIILAAPNFTRDMYGINLKKIISAWSNLPVSVEHDGFCFTLAESLVGAAVGFRHVLGLTLGTGVGGGLVVDKKIYRGYRSLMEVGHMKITDRGFRCSCGRNGHFESQVSGQALSRYFKKITGKAKNGEEIFALTRRGNRAAVRASQQMAVFLGRALANYVNILSPDIIVIGGGVSRFTELLQWGKGEMQKELEFPGLSKTRVVRSKLGDDALLIGAVLASKQSS